MTGEEFVRKADEILEETYEEPMSLTAYLDKVLENPGLSAHSTRYLLDAVEALGTRKVLEEGELQTRYRFFDDPYNDGEHAVLGNTRVLTAFVDDLRAITAGRGKDEKIIWFDGPTATGKSELKRCLVNGLREYSKTPAGRRYTIEWNVVDVDRSPGLTYGDGTRTENANWFESPVQTHPLVVFPDTIREEILNRINTSDDHEPIRVEGSLDPFSREAYEYLERYYRERNVRLLFSSITDPNHLRVKNYVIDVGQGIGVLHSEDDGTPKERLVGSWMPGMLRELDSRGRKNPQAFSYDGVLSQGNGLLTIVEDATQHADLLQKLLNVPDEGHVKLDKGIGMDIDTQLIVISNPDLEAQLNQHSDRNGTDPLKALKRRLDKHRIRYLTNLSLECELLHRELTGQTSIWEDNDREVIDERIKAPITIRLSEGDDQVVERELAPHTIEAGAMYDVVSRLDSDDLPDGISLVDKAILLDRGELRDGDEIRSLDDFDFEPASSDGDFGIPVTYTRDVIAELLAEERDRHHPDLPIQHVIMPDDVLDSMVEGLGEAPVFSRAEQKEFEDRLVPVKHYVYDRLETDVIAAMMRDKRVDESTVEEYVEHVYAWSAGSPIETDHGLIDPDPLKMKVFEIEHLGQFNEGDYDGSLATSAVRSFRQEKIITALNRHAWIHRDEDFEIADVNLLDIPVVKEVLESHGWADVRRMFEDFDPVQWADPPSQTETASVKEMTITNLVEMFGYSPAAAELTSRQVMEEVSYTWS